MTINKYVISRTTVPVMCCITITFTLYFDENEQNMKLYQCNMVYSGHFLQKIYISKINLYLMSVFYSAEIVQSRQQISLSVLVKRINRLR